MEEEWKEECQVGGGRQEVGEVPRGRRRQIMSLKRQETGSLRWKEAGSRRQEAGGRR